MRRAGRLARNERRALAADISRVSRKLHIRAGLQTVPVAIGIALELVATGAGGGAAAIELREALAERGHGERPSI